MRSRGRRVAQWSAVTEPVVVVGVALFDGDRLLAARRTSPAVLAGGWELPGGKVEPGESDLEALEREIREELGVTIHIGVRVGGDWPLGRDRVLRVWTARLNEGVPRPLEEHDVLRWLEPGRYDSVAWLEADRPVVLALEALRLDGGPPGAPGA